MAVNEYYNEDLAQYARGSSKLDGAYFLYCQPDIMNTPKGEYYLARKIFLEEGRYTVKAYGDDIARIKIENQQVLYASSESLGRNPYDTNLPPAEGTFRINQRGSVRLDAFYHEVPDGTPSWIIFSIYDETGALVYASRSEYWKCGGLPIDDDQLDEDGGKDPLSDDRLLLPIWLPLPNWKEGIVERLKWLTWVGYSESNAEQRVANRRFPRREFDVDFLTQDYRRAVMEMGVAAVGQAEWLMPLWMNRVRLDSDAVVGTTTVFADTFLRQFRPGDVVVLRGEQFFDYELSIINEMDDEHLVLTRPLRKTWAAGTWLYPVRVARITQDTSLTWHSSSVGETQVRFLQQEHERQEIDISQFPRHPQDGLPVLGLSNNWREAPTGGYQHHVHTTDYEIGKQIYFDVGGQAQQSLQYSWLTQRREGLDEMRSVLYYLRGKQNLVWIKTLTDDIRVVEQIDSEQGEMTIARIGYSQYAGDDQGIRKHIAIELWSGEILYNRVVSARGRGLNTEVLSLADTLTKDYLPEQIKRVCFISHARLSSDDLEIQHYTDIMGARDITMPFTLIENLRRV